MPKRFLAAAAALVLSTSLFAQAPYLVTDLNSATSDVRRSSSPFDFRKFGDTLFFSADTPGSGRELWKYQNGVASQIADLWAGSTGSAASEVTQLSEGVYLFSAGSIAYGHELWRTDGTAAGTSLVKDTRPGSSAGVASSARLVFNGKMFFLATNGVNGIEPWLTDGTAEGTQMLRDLAPSTSASGPREMTVLGDRLLIFASNGLWSSDGTNAGTTLLATTGYATASVRIGATVFFATNGNDGTVLWKTDGTAAGTQVVKQLRYPGSVGSLPTPILGAMGSSIYFIAGINGKPSCGRATAAPPARSSCRRSPQAASPTARLRSFPDSFSSAC